MPVNVQIQGMDSLMRHFAALEQVAQNQMVERALVAGALLIQNDAKAKAPYLTGNLRRSIHIGGHDDLNPGANAIVDRNGVPVPPPEHRPGQTAVYVGTDVNYAAPVEYGTSRRRGHPYLRPAADEQGAAAAREVGEAFRDLIRAAIT